MFRNLARHGLSGPARRIQRFPMTDRLLPSDGVLLSALMQDEGYAKRLPNGDCIAYPDPVSERARTGSGSGEPWTIGFGCTGPDVQALTVWTRAKAEERLRAKVAECFADLDRSMPWWRTLSIPRQRVLANMAYNLGLPRLRGFKRALAAMQAGDYAEAAAQMLDSRWAAQVGARAQRLARVMAAG